MPTRRIDLWTPKVPLERLHPHFVRLAATPASRDCLNRWADGFEDTDRKIVQEFQTTFEPAFWELYLFATFRSLGFSVRRPKAHPDYVLESPNGDIAVEAKVTLAGPDQIPEWTPKHEVPYDQEEFYRQSAEKLAGAIKSKADSYRTYCQEPHVRDRPFLLCLQPYDHPWFITQHARAIWRVLFQYDQPVGYISEAGNMIETGHRRIESVTKRSGAIVPLGYFLDATYADISAVFFNPRATVGKFFADPKRESHPKEHVFATWYMVSTGTFVKQDVHPSYYRETLADGGYLLLNPFARNQLDPEPFFRQGVTVCSFDSERREMTSRTPVPFLFERVT
jgi:hypothetical protein